MWFKSHEIMATECCHFLSGCLTWARLSCAAEMYITSWANPFLSFSGKEWTKKATPWEAQIQSKKVLLQLAWILTEPPPSKACKWKYLHILFGFSGQLAVLLFIPYNLSLRLFLVGIAPRQSNPTIQQPASAVHFINTKSFVNFN